MSKYTENDLKQAVTASTSVAQVIDKLKLKHSGWVWNEITHKIKDLNIDRSHFIFKRKSYSDAQLADAVKSSFSSAEVVRKLQKSQGGAAKASIRRHIKRLQLDTSHWSLGAAYRTPIAQILIRNSTYKHTAFLKKRLIEELNWKDHCHKCGTSGIWMGEHLTLQLDHINGDWQDNRLENLRILCPNCHSQTPTYGGRNRFKHAGLENRKKRKHPIYRADKGKKRHASLTL